MSRFDIIVTIPDGAGSFHQIQGHRIAELLGVRVTVADDSVLGAWSGKWRP